MKVEIFTRSENMLEEYEYRDAMEIHVDGVKKVSFYDGEPEDANMSRNFSGVYSIEKLMEMAYNAGQNSEFIEWVYTDLNE